MDDLVQQNFRKCRDKPGWRQSLAQECLLRACCVSVGTRGSTRNRARLCGGGSMSSTPSSADNDNIAAQWGWSLHLDWIRGVSQELCGEAGLDHRSTAVQGAQRRGVPSPVPREGPFGKPDGGGQGLGGAHGGPARWRGGTDVGHRWGPRGPAGGPTLPSDPQCSPRCPELGAWATVSSTSQERTANLHL